MPIKNTNGISLPTTTLTYTVSDLLYEAPDDAIVHGTAFANWTVDASSSKSAAGIVVTQSANDQAYINISGLSANTGYWLKVVIDQQSTGVTGNLRVVAVGDTGSNFGTQAGALVDIPAGLGTKFVKIWTDATAGPHRLVIKHAVSPNGEYIRMKTVTLYPIPARSAAKVAVLGDREGTFNATYGTAVDNAILAATADTMNVVSVGDTASTNNSFSTINNTLLTTIRGKGGNMYPAMGNHDYDASRETEWLTFYDHISALNSGKPYYRKVLGEMEFFVMNTCGPSDNSGGTAPADNSGGREAASASAFASSTMGVWLQNALSSSTAKWKIVVIHHPAYTSSSPGAYANCRLPFASWGAHVVIQGHDHCVERIYKDGIYYLVCAMGGGGHHGWGTILPETKWRLDSSVTSSFSTTYGFWKIHDSTTALVLEYYDTNGALLDRCKISR